MKNLLNLTFLCIFVFNMCICSVYSNIIQSNQTYINSNLKQQSLDVTTNILFINDNKIKAFQLKTKNLYKKNKRNVNNNLNDINLILDKNELSTKLHLLKIISKEWTELKNASNQNNLSNFSKTDDIDINIHFNQYFFKSIICILCILIIIAALIGNTLVILAVTIVRKLHTEDNANNYLIVSLAISDLLVGMLVMPFAMHVEINEGHKWAFSAILCDLWTLFDVLLCTASILNLVAISIDRYFIIQHAMIYTQRRNAKLMILMILSVWVLSALISIPPLFGWGRASNNLEKYGVCLVSQDFRYQIYATLLAFYIPLLVMIIIYINIYRTAKKIKKKELQTCGTLKNSNLYLPLNVDNTTVIKVNENFENNRICYSNEQQNNLKSTSYLSTPCNLASFGTPIVIIDSKRKHKDNTKIKSFKNKHSGSISDASNRSLDSKMCSSSSSQDGNTILSSNLNISNSIYIREKSPKLKVRLSRRLTNVFTGIKRHSNMSGMQGKNQKATQTLGIIMGCFILCWLPFFILAVVKPIPLQNGKTIRDFIPTWLDSLLLWLGYFNSALNPVIYARFNREFRRPFIEILCFRCRGINEKLRNEERKKILVDTGNLVNSIAFNNSITRTSTSLKNSTTKAYSDANNNELMVKIDEKVDQTYNLDYANESKNNNNEKKSNPKTDNSENILNGESKYDERSKAYKLNDLVSSRFYNLTIINGMPLSLDKPVISLKIKNKNRKKSHLKEKKNFTEDLNLESQFNQNFHPIKNNFDNKIEETIKAENHIKNTNEKTLKLFFKQQSLNDKNEKQKLDSLKQSLSSFDFNLNMNNKICVKSNSEQLNKHKGTLIS